MATPIAGLAPLRASTQLFCGTFGCVATLDILWRGQPKVVWRVTGIGSL